MVSGLGGLGGFLGLSPVGGNARGEIIRVRRLHKSALAAALLLGTAFKHLVHPPEGLQKRCPHVHPSVIGGISCF